MAVDAVDQFFPAQRPGHLGGGLGANLHHRFPGIKRGVRREDQIDFRLVGLTPQLDKRLVLGCRFGRQYVDAGGGDFPGKQRLRQRGCVHHRTAGGVDEDRVRLHLRQRVCINQALGFLGQRRVQRDHIARREQFLQRNHLHPEHLFRAGPQVWVVGDDAHPHGPGPLRRRLTDPAKANDAQRRSGQALDRLHRPAVPRLERCLQVALGLHEAAVAGDHHADRLIRDLIHSIVRHVADRDAALAGPAKIHCIVPNSAAGNHPAILETIDQFARQRDLVENNDGVGILHPALEFGHRPSSQAYNLSEVAN